MEPNFDFTDMMGGNSEGGGGMGGTGGGMGGGIGGMGGMMNPGTLGMFSSMFGGGGGGGGGGKFHNPADAAMPYLNQIGQQIPQYFNPYINAGNQALPSLQQQYGQLLNNPGGVMNGIGAGFHQSPGYQFQTQQAMGAANRAASAGGMLGSPAEQQSIAGTVNGMANQDYYNYLDHGMNMYGMGLQGMGDMAHMGLSASNGLSDDLMSQYLSQANLAYSGAADQNMNQSGGGGGGGGSRMGGIFSGALSGAGTGSAFGPYGALIGAGVGALGGYFSSKK